VDVRDERTLEKTLREQSKEVGRQLRKSDLAGKTVKIKIRWSDFTTLTRQTTLPTSTDNDDEIFKTAFKLMREARTNQAVRLIGVGVSGLGAPIRQLSLWDNAGSEKSRRLQEVVDQLQEKYGKGIIHRGE
jgi:DNA polymerase-4